jgi:hypothetical protein
MLTRYRIASVKASTSFNCASLKVSSRRNILALVLHWLHYRVFPQKPSTQPVAQKYRVHPIYTILFFLDVENETFSWALIHAQTPLKHDCLDYLMTDLLLQDLKNLTGEGLVQTLSSEKKEMFGEQRAPARERGVNYLFLSLFAGSFTKVRKARGEENVTK